MSAKRRRGGVGVGKLRISLGSPIVAVINCVDNTDTKNLYVISVKGFGTRLNRLPPGCVGDMIICKFTFHRDEQHTHTSRSFVTTVKKSKPDLRKKVMPAVDMRQRKSFRRKDGIFIDFEDKAGVILNSKGEMKGSAITGPVAKEYADLWPRIAANAQAVA